MRVRAPSPYRKSEVMSTETGMSMMIEGLFSVVVTFTVAVAIKVAGMCCVRPSGPTQRMFPEGRNDFSQKSAKQAGLSWTREER